MTKFEMVKYHSKRYPDDIPLRIEEVSGHFDVEELNYEKEISIHTEYSYGKRKFDSELITFFPELLNAQKKRVPQLWKNAEWASQFADFIFALTETQAPLVIELHPPFDDYTDFDTFIENYSLFEKKILARYPQTEIVIENRSGTIYSGGKFIIEKLEDLKRLCKTVSEKNPKLRLAYDIPQLYTAHKAEDRDAYLSLLSDSIEIRDFISSIHLWGKSRSASGRLMAHIGNLNTYFNDEELKKEFLNCFKECFNDNKVRKMVLEVNGANSNMLSIIRDLQSVGVHFI